MSSCNVILNQPEVHDRYLRSLQTCFPGEWDRETYAWYHRRPFRQWTPDLLTVDQRGEIVAGVCLNYRELSLPGDRLVKTGILTAAWTLPAHRGRWHLLRLTREAIAHCRTSGSGALIAFVRRNNASFAVLRRAGAAQVASYYLQARADRPLSGLEQKTLPATRARRPGRSSDEAEAGAVRFHYASSDEWADQLLCRPWPSAVAHRHGCEIVVDDNGTTDGIQFISGPDDSVIGAVAELAADSLRRGKRFFHYSTSERIANAAEAIGFDVVSGYIMVFDFADPADGASELTASDRQWRIQPGDRM